MITFAWMSNNPVSQLIAVAFAHFQYMDDLVCRMELAPRAVRVDGPSSKV
jgi:hypothetical protein